MARYKIRALDRHPTRKVGIWDQKLSVWQTIKPTREEARAWIAAKVEADKNPPPSTLRIRMPLRD